MEENKANWIGIYHGFRNYVKNKTDDYSLWQEKFRTEQINYFKEVEKRLKLIRDTCASDDDFCNRVHMNGYDGKELCYFDGKMMFVGSQFFIGVGYYWNLNDFDKLVHIEK